MNERFRGPETSAEALAQTLLAALQRGGSLSSETRAKLQSALLKDDVNKAGTQGVQPLAKIPETRPSPVRSELFSAFRSEIAQKELARLTAEERAFVVDTGKRLQEATFAHRILNAKIIGAPLREFSHDYFSCDVKLPEVKNFSWNAWGDFIENSFSPEEKPSYPLNQTDMTAFSLF